MRFPSVLNRVSMLIPQAVHSRARIDLYQGLHAIQVASCICAWELFCVGT